MDYSFYVCYGICWRRKVTRHEERSMNMSWQMYKSIAASAQKTRDNDIDSFQCFTILAWSGTGITKDGHTVRFAIGKWDSTPSSHGMFETPAGSGTRILTMDMQVVRLSTSGTALQVVAADSRRAIYESDFCGTVISKWDSAPSSRDMLETSYLQEWLLRKWLMIDNTAVAMDGDPVQ